MKTLILTAALALSTNAFAFDFPSFDTPNSSDWAVAMTAQACNLDLASLKGATGEIAKTENGVVYTVTVGGEVVASAAANSTFIFSAKTCL